MDEYDRIVGDVGLPVGVEVPGYPLAGSTAVLIVRKPGQPTADVVWSPADIDEILETVTHDLEAGDLDRSGNYTMWAVITTAGGAVVISSKPTLLRVGPRPTIP